jgi:hypothetical protein
MPMRLKRFALHVRILRTTESYTLINCHRGMTCSRLALYIFRGRFSNCGASEVDNSKARDDILQI